MHLSQSLSEASVAVSSHRSYRFVGYAGLVLIGFLAGNYRVTTDVVDGTRAALVKECIQRVQGARKDATHDAERAMSHWWGVP